MSLRIRQQTHASGCQLVFLGTTHRQSDYDPLQSALQTHSPDAICIEARPDHGLDGTPDHNAVQAYVSQTGTPLHKCDVTGMSRSDITDATDEDTLAEARELVTQTADPSRIRSEVQALSDALYEVLFRKREPVMAKNIRAVVRQPDVETVGIVVGMAHLPGLRQRL